MTAGWSESDFDVAHAVFGKVLRLTRMMHDGGVPLLAGTD